MFSLLDTILLSQPPVTAMGGGGGATGPAGCEAAGSQMLLLVVMLVAMYFLMIRPQQKQQREHEALLKKLKTGDVVRTDSGIRGEIVKITDREVELLVAERTKINILRTRIAGLDGTAAAQQAPSKE